MSVGLAHKIVNRALKQILNLFVDLRSHKIYRSILTTLTDFLNNCIRINRGGDEIGCKLVIVDT